ncbi:MAG TPA: serine/threonine-protein kinase [Verrucomicrobiae bacterium]|nr:serine/threonine-protein kinase [Verrucomicrobiae bacterium]
MKASTERLIEVFHAAKAIAGAADREQFLAQACGEDRELREQVLSLLEADEQAGDFLKHPQPPTRGASTENPGDKIGHYKLLQSIGEGGCGIVYMAEQEEPVRRRVALKIIKLGMDTKQVVARFEAERQALAMMDHPNIAKVLDAGATQTGRPFFVMELVRGIKITDYCDQNGLTTAERLALFIQVCHAVQHAHQKGVIHRDLKPSNVLVAQHDSVAVPKVIDFGIAKATNGQQLTDKTVFTAFEQFMGTPAYMSPEQAQLSGLDIDTRTDIYALGVLLYELLTGRTPFDQKELLAAGLDEMRRTIREKEPVRPSTRLSTLLQAELQTTARRQQTEPPKLIHLVRGDLDWIVLKCLEKDRGRRYETANGLARDIERHLNNEPVTARSPSNLYRLQKLVRRNRLTFAAGGAVALALLTALMILVASYVRIRRETAEKNAAWAAAQVSEREAKEQLFVALRSQARTLRHSAQMGQRLESLAAIEQAKQIRTEPSLRDEAIAALALPDVRLGPKWSAQRTNCVALACDAAGQKYAQLDSEGVVTVRTLADNREVHRFETGPVDVNVYTALDFSPDGRFLVKVGDWQPPVVWSMDGGQSILENPPNGGSAPTFSADRRFVALAGVKDVFCFDLATGRESNHFDTADRIQTLQFHPVSSRIAVGYKAGPWVSVFDASTGQETARLEVGKSFHTVVAWHPDGRHLAVGGTAGGIQIWDVETQQRVTLLEGAAPEVDFLTYHPSGRWLVSWSWDDVVRLWCTATGRLMMLIPLRGNFEFSHDGRWVGLFWPDEEHVQLLEFVATEEYFTLHGNAAAGRVEHYACAVSPDDRLLAVARDDGVQLWDLPARREVAHLPATEIMTVAFEPDGRMLWTCSRSNGLQGWQIRPSTRNAGLEIGPPQQFELPFTPRRLAADRAFRTRAVVSETPGQVQVWKTEAQSPGLLPFQIPMLCYIAISPDAKWLATSGWHTDRMQLWNLERNEAVRDWVVGLHTKVAFTPDSQELIVARESEFHFLKVATLESSRRFRREIGQDPGDVAFSPDGKLMAMQMSPAILHLKEVSTGRTVAQLEDPFRDRSDAMAFSPDGTQLVVVSTYAAAVHVWDLRAIRARLKAMGLDWDWPEFPPRKETGASSVSRPLKVTVLSGEWR